MINFEVTETWHRDFISQNIFFLHIGTLLLARVIAVTCCVTLAASLAAHHGPVVMAAFQICLQLWLATSLLADGLAVAGQVLYIVC
jgi:Na+-driven multidrug efflux pump